MAVTNKRSQSFYAEQIFKTLGASRRRAAGRWDDALAARRSSSSPRSASTPRGTSCTTDRASPPQNRVAAGDIVKFLRAMNVQPHGAAWRSTLAVSGEPGGDPPAPPADSAMTGGRSRPRPAPLTASRPSPATPTASSGKTYAFAILLNGGRVNDIHGHAYQDRLLRALVKAG